MNNNKQNHRVSTFFLTSLDRQDRAGFVGIVAVMIQRFVDADVNNVEEGKITLV